MPPVVGVKTSDASAWTRHPGIGSAEHMAVLYEASPPGRQGEAVGIRTTMMNGSQTFIPLASGAISSALGMTPVFALIAALLLGGAWFAKTRTQSP